MSASKRNKPKNSKSSDSTYTLMDFQREFPDDAACLEYLWREHFSKDGERAYCPKCERRKRFYRVKSRPSYSCAGCGKHIHPTAGTIFHKSSTSLQLWFYAIYLMSSTRCGISAKQLERELGVTYKTAWRMANLIRNHLMEQDDESLQGDVEMDETFFGGKPRAGDKMPRGVHKEKTIVIGAVERKGRVKADVVPHLGGLLVHGYVRKYVAEESNFYTDEYGAYKAMAREGYLHQTVNHKKQIYAQGTNHVQTIEGFWSLMKNSIRGTHRWVSPQWLQSYVNEYVFRYNNRKENMFILLLERTRIKAL